MIKLNRTTEYGLMALRHISGKNTHDPKDVTSAREIADSYGLPFEITAKTLQRLKDSGLIQSAQGAKGGYILQRALEQVSLGEFLELMEGPQSIVACASTEIGHAVGCEYGDRCEIRPFMNEFNTRLFDFLSEIQLADFIKKTKYEAKLEIEHTTEKEKRVSQ